MFCASNTLWSFFAICKYGYSCNYPETVHCHNSFPVIVHITKKLWETVSKRVLQIETPKQLQEKVSDVAEDTIITLYAPIELKDWEDYTSFPAYMHAYSTKSSLTVFVCWNHVHQGPEISWVGCSILIKSSTEWIWFDEQSQPLGVCIHGSYLSSKISWGCVWCWSMLQSLFPVQLRFYSMDVQSWMLHSRIERNLG